MYRFFFFLTFMLMSMAIYATGQEGDIIYIDGTQWELLGKPIYEDSELSRELKASLPEGRGLKTSNWSGYTAYWSIQQGTLCLDSILYDIYVAPQKVKTERLSSNDLFRVFKKYADGKRIIATWFNKDIRVAKGKRIYYEHDAYRRNYENERIYNFEHGKVSGMKDYQNYVVDGFSFDNYNPKNHEELRKKFPLHIEQYQDLAEIERIVFSIKRARVDAQGHLYECEVEVLRPKDNQRLATDIAESLKAYHPWRVLYINGEYQAYGIEHQTISYVFNK